MPVENLKTRGDRSQTKPGDDCNRLPRYTEAARGLEAEDSKTTEPRQPQDTAELDAAISAAGY